MHIWISDISLITNIPSLLIMKYFPLVLSLFFMISIFLWNKSIFADKPTIILSTILGFIPFIQSYNTVLVPNAFSLILVPLILFIYLNKSKKSGVKYSIMLILFLILIPFSHPLTSIMLIVFLLVIPISNRIYDTILNSKETSFLGLIISIKTNYFIDLNSMKKSYSLIPAGILIIIFFMWLSSYAIFNNSVSRVTLWLNGELKPPLNEISGTLNKLNLSLEGKIFLFLKIYGYDFLLICLGLISILIIIRKLKRGFEVERNIFAIINCFIFSSIMMVVLLFSGDPNFEVIRFLKFIFLMAVPLAGYALNEFRVFIIDKFSGKKFSRLVLSGIMVILIVSGFVASSFAIYDSPITLKPSLDTSRNHFNGMEWFYNNKDSSIKGTALQSSAPWRFAEAIYGEKNYKKRDDVNSIIGWGLVVPYHFAYKNFTSIGNYYNDSRYMPISNVDIMPYLTIWSVVDRYNSSDINKLNNDKAVIKIYDTQDITIWAINF